MVVALPKSGPPISFGQAEANVRSDPDPSTPLRVVRRLQAEPPCPYDQEALAMVEKCTMESEIAERATAEFNQVSTLREHQVASARREVIAARESSGMAESLAFHAHLHEEFFMRHLMWSMLYNALLKSIYIERDIFYYYTSFTHCDILSSLCPVFMFLSYLVPTHIPLSLSLLTSPMFS